MENFKFCVSNLDAGLRLDVFILKAINNEKPGFSRTLVQKFISERKITIDGQDLVKPHYKVKPNDIITVEVFDRRSKTLLPENIPLEVVYEDDDLAIINKQIGLVVHPAPGNYEHTLVNALLFRFKNLSDINPNRPGIVHRLDKETSGLLVIAKNNAAHLKLAEQFSEHSIKRKYVAIVDGKIEFDEGQIEAPLARHALKRESMAVSYSQNSKEALTRYRTLKRGKDFSLLELEPFTGRTHQLRVHLAFIGYPILGDAKYGKRNQFKRLALHAKYLGFIHPTKNKFVEFASSIPREFEEFLKDKKT